MKKLYVFLFLTAIASLHQSCREDCSKSVEMENIQIPFTKVEDLDISEGKLIPLETTSETSLVPSITNLDEIRDTIILASSRSVFMFDEFGKFLGTVGAVGHANSEYMDTRSVFVYDNKINVFDWSKRRIISYDSSGKYVSKQDIGANERNIYPSSLFRTNDDCYLSVNCYQGEDILTPAFSLFSLSGDWKCDIKGLIKKDGMTRNELRFSSLTNSLLYTEIFNDTIYRVMPGNKETIKAYYIDYGKYKFTESEKAGKNFAEMCQYSNTEEIIKTKAGPMFCCYETVENVMFVFTFHKKVHFVCYDKDTHDVRIFRLQDKTGRLEPTLFAAYTKNNVFFSCAEPNNVANNPVLVKFSFDKFRK